MRKLICGKNENLVRISVENGEINLIYNVIYCCWVKPKTNQEEKKEIVCLEGSGKNNLFFVIVYLLLFHLSSLHIMLLLKK